MEDLSQGLSVYGLTYSAQVGNDRVQDLRPDHESQFGIHVPNDFLPSFF